ncbi:hypothetical protein Tco_0769215 [Tanacetum coccineum]|uniref:Uncharacterized protein n=1 Tax=Tanacetum coccineum TaxID=301880 RepID=A0ABQ4Z8S9_9ASTR
MDEPEPHPAYDFFAPRLLPGQIRIGTVLKLDFIWDSYTCNGSLGITRNWKLRFEHSAKSGGLLASISGLLSGRRVTYEYLRSELEGKWNWIDPRAIEIEAYVPLLGELGAEEDEPMVSPVVDEIVEMEEQVIAPVIDVEEDIAMLFRDDNFSNDNSEGFEDEEEVWEVNKE